MRTANAAAKTRGGLRQAAGWLAAAAVVMLGMGAFAGMSLIDLRRDAMNEASRSAENLVQALQQDIDRTISTYELSLNALTQALALPDIDDVSPGMRSAALFDGAAGAAFLGGMIATDATGHLVASNLMSRRLGEDFSTRDFFILHRDHPEVGLNISRPFLAHSDGAPVIAFSHRRSAPDGSFRGIVIGTLRIAYFTDLATRFRLGKGSLLALITTSGRTVARVPPLDRVGADISRNGIFKQFLAEPSGQVEGVSELDGQRRLYNFSHVGALPLIVAVGVTTETIYADWNRRAQIIGPILLLMTLLGGGVLALLGFLRHELALRRGAERESRRSAAIYRIVAENSNDVVTCLDPGGTNVYVSPSIYDLTGYAPEHFADRPFVEAIHEDDRPGASRLLDDLRDGDGRATLTYRCAHCDGRIIWVETSFRQLRNPSTNAPEEVVATTRDITRRKLADEEMSVNARELALLAATDGLTGLANRRQFDSVLAAEWLRARREGNTLSLLMIDADFFKSYNDTYGHSAGDEVLRAIARTLREHARRPADFSARYGGEEFAVILPATELEGAVQVAEHVRRALTTMAIEHAGSANGSVTVSIGVAAAVGDGQGAGQNLVEAADAALYEAKRLGRNRTEIYGAGTTPLRSLRGSAV